MLANCVYCNLGRDGAASHQRLHIGFGVRQDKVVLNVRPAAMDEGRDFLCAEAHSAKPLESACRFKWP
ncbi:hypothetical protein D3C87_1886500 [compost metagenome]